MEELQIIECPRDALQGWRSFIPTKNKIAYMESLLKIGFHTLDCGSFVSPKAIPQMADTAKVIEAIGPQKQHTKLAVIVANLRGAQEACAYDAIDCLGYPFSISENFQMRNTGKTIAESLRVLAQIIALAEVYGKELIVYISMGFGNPYGDVWHPDIVANWVGKLIEMGVHTLSLSDTVGCANTTSIRDLFSRIVPEYKETNIGAHLHTTPQEAIQKLAAAYTSGCKRFDGAIMGVGGCPMAQDELVGNMPTEKIISYFESVKVKHNLRPLQFETAYNKALDLFV